MQNWFGKQKKYANIFLSAWAVFNDEHPEM